MFTKLVEETIAGEKAKVEDLEIYNKTSITSSDLAPAVKKFILNIQGSIDTKEQLNTLIEKAVKLNFNYTIRPKWTLLNFLFGNVESKSVKDIQNRIGIFQFYKFYTDLIWSYIQDNSLIIITRSQVESLIDEANHAIYDKLVNNISNVKVKNFFKQIFKLKYKTDMEINLEASVPFSLIKLFLEDKSFNDLLDKFYDVEDIKDTTELSLKDIIKIATGKYKTRIENIIPSDEISEPVLPPPDEQVNTPDTEKGNDPSIGFKVKGVFKDTSLYSKELEEAARIKPPVLGELPRELADAAKVKLPELKENGIETEDAEIINKTVDLSVASVSSDAGDIAESPEEISVRHKKDSSKESAAEKLVTAGHKNEIEDLFKPREKKNILKYVFKMSYISMTEFFDEIQEILVWEKVKERLKIIFKENNVDIYNKTVIQFVDTLNNYYQKKN
jgi:hypothetical protein